jgi:hypothetical protein
MRLFTFSGIRGGLFGTNPGTGLVSFAQTVISKLPRGDAPGYNGTTGVDHFPSSVSIGTILANHEAVLSMNGAPELDAEAETKAPFHAAQIAQALSTDSDTETLILAHSQGANNAAHTLREMLDQDLIGKKRILYIAMFDSKVSPLVVDELFRRNAKFKFLFFQSENDVLGNQNLQRRKFSDAFPHGDHLWVKGLNHGTIVSAPHLTRPQEMLTLLDYLKFQRDYDKERININVSPHDPAPTATKQMRLKKFVKNYKPSVTAPPMDALVGFLRGQLAGRFES